MSDDDDGGRGGIAFKGTETKSQLQSRYFIDLNQQLEILLPYYFYSRRFSYLS